MDVEIFIHFLLIYIYIEYQSFTCSKITKIKNTIYKILTCMPIFRLIFEIIIKLFHFSPIPILVLLCS